MSKPHRFWAMTINMRWRIRANDERWAIDTEVRLRKGKKLPDQKWPSPPPRFQADGRPPTDITRPIGTIMYVVSDGFREVLESEAPGAAQFFPVQIDSATPIEPSYWAINWTRAFDCMDAEKSLNTDKETGETFVEMPVIDPSRVPPDGLIGVLKGFEVLVLVRNDLRLKMKKAGLKGVLFDPVAHSADTLNFKKS